jgi:ethanolamine utilization protein EutN
MLTASVIGHAVATVKHSSLQGLKLLVLQPLDARGQPDGDPQVGIDQLGSRLGDEVLVTGDGNAVNEMLGRSDCPVRWAVIGLRD